MTRILKNLGMTLLSLILLPFAVLFGLLCGAVLFPFALITESLADIWR